MAINMSQQIGFIKLNPKAKNPIRGSKASAGFDLYSVERCQIKSSERALVNTGLTFVMPYGTYARIAARSSYAVRGIDVGAGVIDPDYIGQVKVLLINNSDQDFIVEEGDRCAQVIFEYYHTASMVEIVYHDPSNDKDDDVIKVVKTDPNIRVPEKYSDQSVSFDFFAQASFLMQPKSRKKIQTGLKFIFSPKTYGYISGKIDLAAQGLDCLEGFIDADPDGGEAEITLVNKSNLPIFIEKGEKIAKIIFVKNASVVNATIVKSIKVEASPIIAERGTQGFGSTGNR